MGKRQVRLDATGMDLHGHVHGREDRHGPCLVATAPACLLCLVFAMRRVGATIRSANCSRFPDRLEDRPRYPAARPLVRAITTLLSVDRRSFLLGSLGLATLGGVGCGDGSDQSSNSRRTDDASRGVTNVVVYADDMRLDELPFVPFVGALAERGTEFTLARQMTPLCSPARAGFMRGQYANGPNGHGIVAQNSNYAVLEDEMLPVWLDRAGVECGLVGKYFVGLRKKASPGWTFWRSPFGKDKSANTGYSIGREDGTVEQPEMEQSTYFASQCESFVREARPPWFLWYCPNDPHTPLEGTAERQNQLIDFSWPVPSFDVQGKPSYIRSLPEPDEATVERMQSQQRARLRELLDLDEAVARIWAALEATEQDEQTVVLVTSDNGNALLDHRLPTLSKSSPYDVCMRVPLLATGPGFTPGQRIDTPVAVAQDLTATVLYIFGAEAPVPLDGRSLRDVANGQLADEDRRLLGHCDPANGPPGMPPCDIITTSDRRLTRYRGQSGADEFELYETDVDPDELLNQATDGNRAEEVQSLSVALDELQTA